MKDREPEIREGRVITNKGEANILIVDNGEDLEPQNKGYIPNHDKVEIIYVRNSFESSNTGC
jgi:hypothetical protein